MDKDDFEYKVENTGDISFRVFKNIDYAFDRFLVKVKVTQSNEFVGIESITENRDFRSFKQKLQRQNYHYYIKKFFED